MKISLTFYLMLCMLMAVGQLPPEEAILRKIEKQNAVYQPIKNNQRGAPEQDCNNALAVCQSTYVQPASYSGHGDQQEVPTSSCLGTRELNSVWYVFTVQVAGSLTFTIDPNVNSDDYDFALYNITGRNCSDIVNGAAPEVRCNYCVDAGNTGISTAGSNSSEDCCTNSPGCQFSSVLNVSVGQTFVLTVSNYTSSNSGYTLTFGGTANIFDNVPAEPVSAITPCGVNYMTVQMSEPILCSSIVADGSDFTLTGPGGPFTTSGAVGVNCGNATSQITLSFSPQVIIGSNYNLTLNTGSDGNSLIDNCANEATGGTSLNFTAVPPNPEISGPNSSCFGTAVTLSASSGSAYVWSTGETTQAISVDPIVPTTYTVTITNGSCVQTATHTVNVRDAPTANFTFTPANPCVGDAVQFSNSSTYLGTCFLTGGSCSNNGDCLFNCLTNLSANIWEFGDAGTSTAKNPNHTYTSPGTYNVSLLVYDLPSGCTNEIVVPITVVADIGPLQVSNDTTVCSGSSVTLSATNGSTYSWTSNPVGFVSTDSIITVTPVVNTIYTVSSMGCSSNTSETVSVTTTLPDNVTVNNTTCDLLNVGSVTNTETNQFGCDSFVTINTTLLPSSTGTFTDTICANTVYTLPSGINVFGPGTYADTIPGSICDSIISVSLISPPSSIFYGLYASSASSYQRLNPLTGVLQSTFGVSANSLGWINGAFTIHEQAAKLYWISDEIELNSLDLTSGVQNTTNTAISTLPFFWGLRYYNGFLYTVTTSADNDKVLVRINPSTGNLDAGFTGIEINGSASSDILIHSSPVINPSTGMFYLPLYGNVLLAYDVNAGTGNIVNLSGYITPGGTIGLLEMNEKTGEMYALSGFSDLVKITVTGASTATVSLVKSLTTASGMANSTSTFDSDNNLYIFQAETGCSTQQPLVVVDVTTGQEWCSDPVGLVFEQLEYLNCKPSSVLRK